MLNPHPGLPEFEYIKPTSLLEASTFLVQHAGEARPFSGGTDCFVRMRDGVMEQKYMVDIKGLDGMNEITFDPTHGLTVGAAVNMNRVAAHPEVVERYSLLAEAAGSVASYQLRTRATIIGNICNASPAGDTIGASMVLDAKLRVFNAEGERLVPLSGFFHGPGKTSLKPGDIVTAVIYPIPPKDFKGRFIKLGRNKLGDLSIVAITVFGYPDTGSKSGFRFRIVLSSVAPTPLEVTAAAA
ncbi:MAG: FAD binding domain-containing protein, partial [Anaerolineaceae bacterium]|nr:FAD binding domain-containing protein [Anaerolineaceae bacterium]